MRAFRFISSGVSVGRLDSPRDHEGSLIVPGHRVPAPFRPCLLDWTHETDSTGLWPRRHRHHRPAAPGIDDYRYQTRLLLSQPCATPWWIRTGCCAVIGRQGAVCGNVRHFSGRAYMTEHAVVVCAANGNGSHYLASLLSTMNLGRLSGQSAQAGLSVRTLSKQVIDLPLLKEQRQDVELLGSLDEKIETNNRTNGYLPDYQPRYEWRRLDSRSFSVMKFSRYSSVISN